MSAPSCTPLSLVQVVMWLNQNFLLVDEYCTESTLDVAFLCLRSLPNKQTLCIKMDHNGEVFHRLFADSFMEILKM